MDVPCESGSEEKKVQIGGTKLAIGGKIIKVEGKKGKDKGKEKEVEVVEESAKVDIYQFSSMYCESDSSDEEGEARAILLKNNKMGNIGGKSDNSSSPSSSSSSSSSSSIMNRKSSNRIIDNNSLSISKSCNNNATASQLIITSSQSATAPSKDRAVRVRDVRTSETLTCCSVECSIGNRLFRFSVSLDNSDVKFKEIFEGENFNLKKKMKS